MYTCHNQVVKIPCLCRNSKAVATSLVTKLASFSVNLSLFCMSSNNGPTHESHEDWSHWKYLPFFQTLNRIYK